MRSSGFPKSPKMTKRVSILSVLSDSHVASASRTLQLRQQHRLSRCTTKEKDGWARGNLPGLQLLKEMDTVTTDSTHQSLCGLLCKCSQTYKLLHTLKNIYSYYKCICKMYFLVSALQIFSIFYIWMSGSKTNLTFLRFSSSIFLKIYHEPT